MNGATLAHAPAVAGARRRLALPLAVAAGGALLMLGARLPWLTLFAGLRPLGGTEGLHGRLLFGAGAVATLLAAMLRAASSPGASVALRRAATALGAAAVGLAAWVLVGLVEVVRAQATNPMVLARYGPGVFVALAGALVVAAAPVLAARRR